jgi:aspartate aminotransferase
VPTSKKVPRLSIELAQRLTRIRPSATVSITALAQRLREQGRDIVVLSVGEPDFPTPTHIKAAATAALARDETKYTPVDGARLLKEAVVAKLARDNGLRYAPEQVLISSGAKQSCYNACLALLDAGDEAIIPAPYWVSYPDMVRLADAEPVIIASTAARGFKISSVLREHPRIVVLSDEIYEHIHWAGEPFTSFAAACPDLYERTLTVNGMSKGYAMSGWRIGYTAGPAAVVKAMTSLQGQSTTNACTISQAAAREALIGDQRCVREMCDEFKRRHDFFFAGIRGLPGFACVPASGTFYLFPNVEGAMRKKRIESDAEFCERLLEDAGVALVPGTAFGAPGHVRLSFAASTATLTSALERLEHFVSG